MDRRTFLRRLAAGSTAAAAGAGSYAWALEPHWVEVVRRELPVAGLPARLEGIRLVQISDLHAGPRVDGQYLIECLRLVRTLAPDILTLTGDVLSARGAHDDAAYRQLRAVLAHLPSGTLGTFAILGNHEYGRGWSDAGAADRATAELERAGATVLRNASVAVAGLDIVGVDDLWARRADPRRALGRRSGAAALVLCHNPDALDELDWAGYKGWILAGHTHGGQCRPPLLPPPILPVRNRRYAAGEVLLADGRRLYVNRGLGHLQRVRFNVRPEISVFTLRRDPGSVTGSRGRPSPAGSR
jgi:predicted MPP superfamily phosphohydrolase